MLVGTGLGCELKVYGKVYFCHPQHGLMDLGSSCVCFSHELSFPSNFLNFSLEAKPEIQKTTYFL